MLKRKRSFFNDTSKFKLGEKLLIDQWGNGQWEEGIFLGARPQSGFIAPIVAKVKKDGTESKNRFYPNRWTKLKSYERRKI